MSQTPWVRTFSTLDRHATEIAGGKGANLGELLRAHLPVPDGFVVTAATYRAVVEAAGLRAQLLRAAEAVQTADSSAMDAHAERTQSLLATIALPQDIAQAIIEAYRAMGGRPDGSHEPAVVAVRSSATAEDSADASFAGMNRSYTNVVGEEALLDAVRGCWASLWSARSQTYRTNRGVAGEPGIAVVVQLMVAADRSGVAFSADPSTGRRDRVVIEAALGQGEVVVSGRVEPDTYVVARNPRRLESVRIGLQSFRIVRGADGGDETQPLSDVDAGRRVLTDGEILEVAALTEAVESVYGGVPMDIEWAFESATLWLLQARPITTLDATGSDAAGGERAEQPGPVRRDAEPHKQTLLLRGLAASPGVISGRVRVLSDPRHAELFQPGEILVTTMTDPDWAPLFRRAGAVVTDGGGMTCHAAIVSRELGVPAVVATRHATTVLRDGQLVTVDGGRGAVFDGAAGGDEPTAPSGTAPLAPTVLRTAERGGALMVAETAAPLVAGRMVFQPPAPVTATKLLVNLARTERVEEIAALDVEGVGLLRAEMLATDALGGEHPRRLIEGGRSAEFVSRMAESVLRISRAFAPRPVIYRTFDFRTNEFRHLAEGERFEPQERNPMIGYRGCYRYVREPDLFALETAMLAEVRDETPNVAVMIPFVRTRWELEACLELIDASPLGAQRGLQRWIMAEVPSVVYRLPEYAALGIDGVSIGSNDLTQLMLGVDRDSEWCIELFDESDDAVLDVINRIIIGAHDAGMTASLCGQAPSSRPAFAEELVKAGIDSVSVDAASLSATRSVLAAAEQRVLLAAARRDLQSRHANRA